MRARITTAKTEMLNAIKDVFEERKEYLPLSDRQVHYALLNNPPLRHSKKKDSTYKNDRKSYQDLTDLLTRARIAGDIPYDWVSDETRPQSRYYVFESLEDFMEAEKCNFLRNYSRDYQISQPDHIEIIGEKNTIAGIISPVASRYRIPLTISRGYCSLRPKYDLVERELIEIKEKVFTYLEEI